MLPHPYLSSRCLLSIIPGFIASIIFIVPRAVIHHPASVIHHPHHPVRPIIDALRLYLSSRASVIHHSPSIFILSASVIHHPPLDCINNIHCSTAGYPSPHPPHYRCSPVRIYPPWYLLSIIPCFIASIIFIVPRPVIHHPIRLIINAPRHV